MPTQQCTPKKNFRTAAPCLLTHRISRRLCFPLALSYHLASTATAIFFSRLRLDEQQQRQQQQVARGTRAQSNHRTATATATAPGPRDPGVSPLLNSNSNSNSNAWAILYSSPAARFNSVKDCATVAQTLTALRSALLSRTLCTALRSPYRVRQRLENLDPRRVYYFPWG